VDDETICSAWSAAVAQCLARVGDGVGFWLPPDQWCLVRVQGVAGVVGLCLSLCGHPAEAADTDTRSVV